MAAVGVELANGSQQYRQVFNLRQPNQCSMSRRGVGRLHTAREEVSGPFANGRCIFWTIRFHLDESYGRNCSRILK